MDSFDESWIKEWDSAGQTKFIELCKETQHGRELSILIYNVCSKVISGQLKANSVIRCLQDVIKQKEDGPNILADVLLVCDLETQTEPKERRDNFLHLLVTSSGQLVYDGLTKERLDYETTSEAGILPNLKQAQTKFIKLKTRLFYKQQKFNLFREESEGYAKLITELSQNRPFDVGHMLQVIRSLIGCFNLDPNRVLDIILETFEQTPLLEDSYIPLIKQFLDSDTTLTQIMAFKYSFYKTVQTPESLYILTAILISRNLISAKDIFTYLQPDDKLIDEHQKQELSDAREIAKRATIISTAEEKPKEDKFSEEEKFSLINNNQKAGLCSALIQIGNWSEAYQLMTFMPENYCVSRPGIARHVCTLIEIGIDDIYRANSGLTTIIQKQLKPIVIAPLIKHMKPVQSVQELMEKVFPTISTIGPFVYHNMLLVNKLIRLSRALLVSHPDLTKSSILDMLDEVILPSLSLIEANCGLSEELWQLLKLLPYENRYRLYYGWRKEPVNNALLLKKRALILKRIKYILKRLSKENVKLSGRQIGKLSHSNPSFLADNIITQIQSYDNLIGPVVDSLKFFTSLSFDVLVYCIIEALADSSKGRTKHDGASISPWILSLANFCGSVVKKYNVELPGLFQFIANQLKAERSLDLLILKEIVGKMAGIEATESMTNEQLAALSGGDLLRQEGGYFNQVRNTRRSSIRLKDALLENHLAMPLCILMAQQRHCILYREQEHSHLKLVGKLYDQCQETLVQFGTFLSISLSIDDYSGRLPSLEKLILEYNLSADIAFFLVRPMVSHKITVKFEEIRKQFPGTDMVKNYLTAWEDVTESLVQAVKPVLHSRFWDDLSPRFFVTFWTLSMYDLEVPKQSYDRETEKLKLQISQTEDNKELNLSKRKKDIERNRLLLEKLLEEQLKQDQHVSRVRARLEHEKDQWFQSKVAKMEMTTQFLQHCLFPRCIFTASDSLFCAKFVYLLHSLKTPNFSTLICYDRIFGDISYTMCSCTENEANHYGRFLNAVLETVMRWHKDKTIFDKECSKYPGFVTKFCETDPVHVDYENYRHVCHKWHYRLTKAFILCLDSEDYIQIRNSLLVLTKIIAFFPIIANFAQALEKRVEMIRSKEKDNRKDLYALATGFSGQLKLKKPTFVAESEFHIKEAKPPPSQEAKPPPSQEAVKQQPVSVKQETVIDVKQEKSETEQDEPSKSQKTASDEKNLKRSKVDKVAENGNGHSHNHVQVKKEPRESTKSTSSVTNRERAPSRNVRIEPAESKNESKGKKLFEQLKIGSSSADRNDGRPNDSAPRRATPPSNRSSPSPKKRKRSRSPVDEKKRDPKKRLSDDGIKKRIDEHVEKQSRATSRGRSHDRRPNEEDYRKPGRHDNPHVDELKIRSSRSERSPRIEHRPSPRNDDRDRKTTTGEQKRVSSRR